MKENLWYSLVYLFKCEDLLLLSVLHHCKLNVFGFWTPVRQNIKFEANMLGYENVVVVSQLCDILEPKQLDHMK